MPRAESRCRRAQLLRRAERLVGQRRLELLLYRARSVRRAGLRLRGRRAGLGGEEEGRGICGRRSSSVSWGLEQDALRAAHGALASQPCGPARERARPRSTPASSRETERRTLLPVLAPVAVLGPEDPARLGRLLLQHALAARHGSWARRGSALARASRRLVMEVRVRVLLVVVEPGALRATEHRSLTRRAQQSRAGRAEKGGGRASESRTPRGDERTTQELGSTLVLLQGYALARFMHSRSRRARQSTTLEVRRGGQGDAGRTFGSGSRSRARLRFSRAHSLRVYVFRGAERRRTRVALQSGKSQLDRLDETALHTCAGYRSCSGWSCSWPHLVDREAARGDREGRMLLWLG